MVRIRLMRMGKKKYPIYRVVAKHNLSPRQGDALEFWGYYDPKRKVGKVNLEAVEKWIQRGAQVTDRAKAIIKLAKKYGGEIKPPEEAKENK